MRRSKGEGSISKRRDGRWQASLQIHGQRRTVYAKTRREAAAKLALLRRQAIASGQLADARGRTVNDLLDLWLQTKSTQWRPKTYHQCTFTCQRHIRPALGPLKLTRLAPSHLQALCSSLQQQGKHRTAQQVRWILHSALQRAVQWGWLDANPCDRVDPARYRPPQKTIWSPDQARFFLSNVRDSRLGPFWAVAIATGARIGELIALEWADLDLEHGALQITKTRQRINGQWLTLPPKTAAGVRILSLPAFALDALRQLRQQTPPDQERIFPYAPESLVRALHRECDRLGLPHLTPHGLRHLHASLLLDSGLPVPSVAARLGHANPSVTLAIYAHSLSDPNLPAQLLDRQFNLEKDENDPSPGPKETPAA